MEAIIAAVSISASRLLAYFAFLAAVCFIVSLIFSDANTPSAGDDQS